MQVRPKISGNTPDPRPWSFNIISLASLWHAKGNVQGCKGNNEKVLQDHGTKRNQVLTFLRALFQPTWPQRGNTTGEDTSSDWASGYPFTAKLKTHICFVEVVEVVSESSIAICRFIVHHSSLMFIICFILLRIVIVPFLLPRMGALWKLWMRCWRNPHRLSCQALRSFRRLRAWEAWQWRVPGRRPWRLGLALDGVSFWK